MVSVKFSVIFWGILLLFAHFHSGQSLFLGIKKELLKHKLYKLKEALFSDHDSYDEVHYHYKPYYISSGYSKYSPSYSSYGYSKYSPSYSSYGWPSYSGWSSH